MNTPELITIVFLLVVAYLFRPNIFRNNKNINDMKKDISMFMMLGYLIGYKQGHREKDRINRFSHIMPTDWYQQNIKDVLYCGKEVPRLEEQTYEQMTELVDKFTKEIFDGDEGSVNEIYLDRVRSGLDSAMISEEKEISIKNIISSCIYFISKVHLSQNASDVNGEKESIETFKSTLLLIIDKLDKIIEDKELTDQFKESLVRTLLAATIFVDFDTKTKTKLEHYLMNYR